MARCKKCSVRLDHSNVVTGHGICVDCFKDANAPNSDDRSEEIDSKSTASRRNQEIAAILVTTETHSNLNILERFDIVSAECALGINAVRDFFVGVRNIVGGRSSVVQDAMRDARETVLYELKRDAHRLGANAVVGVDLDYVELAATGSTMLLIVASGTAVRVEAIS